MLSFVLLQLEPLFRYDAREWPGESNGCAPNALLPSESDDTDHDFFGCVDSRNVWTAASGVLCDALGCDRIEDAEYTTLQRLFGLPKLKAKLSEQEGAGRMIEIFTEMVLEMISSGRWRM